MNFLQWLQSLSFSNIQFVPVFFKLFAIILSLIYLLYSIVLYRQVSDMNHTLQTAANDILSFLALLQILAALLLLGLAIFLV